MKRHWTRKLVVGSVAGVLVLVSVAFSLFALPGIWFNRSVLNAVAPGLLSRVGVGLSWNSLEADTQWRSPRRRSFRLKLKEVELIRLPVTGKVESVEAQVTVVWWALPPRLEAVEKLQASSSSLKIVTGPDGPQDQPQDQPSSDPSSFLPDLHLTHYVPTFLTRLEIGEVNVDAKSLRIIDSMQPVAARLYSDTSGGKRGLRLEASSVGLADVRELSATAVLPISSQRRIVLSRAQVDGELTWGGLGWVKVKLALQDCGKNSTCGKLDASLTPPQRKNPTSPRGVEARAKVQITVREDTGQLDISGSVARIFPWLPEVAAQAPCKVEFDLRTQDELKTTLGCALRAKLKIPPVSGVPSLRLPTLTRLKIRGHANLEKLTGDPRLSGDLALETNPILRPLLESTLRSKSEFHAEFKDLSRSGLDGFHHETQLIVDARVPKIDVAEKMLEDTPWAIPAPFNNLNGALSLKLEAQWKDWSTTAPFRLRTQLESSEQALQTHAEGEFDFRLRPSILAKIKADVALDNVRLSAPRLTLTEVPRFFPDSQIKPASAVKAPSQGPPVFAYDILAHTPSDHPLRIDTNLVSKPLSFDIRAHIKSDAPIELAIHTRPFDFERLRQVAHVEKFNIDLATQDKSPRLEVKAGIPKGDYKIYINVNGTTDKAKIAVSSEPPAPQDEVWALLLYGEPMSALDIDQQSNAQSSKQAISRGAFGILSLWALASTPIERIDYDPVTKRASARMHLAEGTSLEVGTSETEGRSVGLRKRLGRGWAVNAQVSSQTQDDSSKSPNEAGASLEWSSRY